MRLSAVSIVTFALLSFAPCALCQTGSAKQHFAAGVRHAEAGDYGAALLDFEQAYAVRPHFSVLFNIAQAHAALDHPAEAREAFERYLRDGGNAISEARREQVRSMLAQQSARLGEVEFKGLPTGARVWVDGRELDPGTLMRPLQLSQGVHSVISSQGTGFPTAEQVEVIAGKVTKYEPALPAVAVSLPRAATGILRVTCRVPGVRVELDNQFAFMTPRSDGVETEAGERTVRFSRAGYAVTERKVLVAPSAPTEVNCDISPSPGIQRPTSARLEVRAYPPAARVMLDGERWHNGVLPYGIHALRVEHDGFTPEEKAIIVPLGKTLGVTINLEPTLATRRAQLEAKRRRFLAYSTGAGGLAFVIAGGITLGWNGGRYDDWRATHESASPGQQLQTVASVQRADDLAFGALAAGAGLLIASTWLFLSGPSSSTQ